APGGSDRKEPLAPGRPERPASPEPALPAPGRSRPPCQVLGDLAPHIPARDLAGAAGPLLHWTPVPAQPDPLRRPRNRRSDPPGPRLSPRGDLRLGPALAARDLRRRGVLSHRPPRVPGARDPARARGAGAGAVGGSAGGAGTGVRAAPGGAGRAGRAAAGRPREVLPRPAGPGRRAPAARG